MTSNSRWVPVSRDFSKSRALTQGARSVMLLLAMGLAGCSSSQPPDTSPILSSAPSVHALGNSGVPSGGSSLGPDAVAKQNFLDTYIDKTAIKYSYHAHNGDYVDCVDILRQPSMLAPGMAGQTIASPPPEDQAPPPRPQPNGATLAQTEGEAYAATTDESGNVRQCPAQTIPVRRILPETLALLPSLASFLSKYPGTPSSPPPGGAQNGYMHANYIQNVQNVGLVGYPSLNFPYVQSGASPAYEHSIGQFWMLNTTSTLETAEYGWAEDPSLWGDYSDPYPRLFIFATNDNYAHGNWNLTCNPGAPCFTQTASGTWFGDTFGDYSVPGGSQYDIYIYDVIYSGNLWVYLNTQWLGYWSGSGYSYMTSTGSGGGSQAEAWGGEVYSGAPAQAWTETEMGSGAFSDQGAGEAAYMYNVEYMQSWGTNVDTSGTLQTNTGYDSNCYTLSADGTDSEFYGGPGWAEQNDCP
jgi:Neprosin